jgi:drug/metabolite transporter (DMT)-like permease
VLWLYALDKLPLNTAGFGSLAVPVVGVFTAWVQLGEQPNLAEGIGMGLIVVGLAVLTAREMRIGQRVGLPRPVAKPAH